MAKTNFKSVDEYLEQFPEELRKIFEQVRSVIKKELPKSEETISYQIPTYKINGKYLIYFAGYKKHVSIYPVHPEDFPFKDELLPYSSGAATLKFTLDKPIPFDLIKKIVNYKKSKLDTP